MESDLFKEISSLETEKINPESSDIDVVETKRILEIINDEDQKVALAVRNEIDYISQAVDRINSAFRQGGRLFYIGAGTSGRLGVVDASECPPTFGVDFDMVQGIIAGGKAAIYRAQEGAEDKEEFGAIEIMDRGVMPPDIVCGIAASGRTPYVVGALKEAKRRGTTTILVTTNSREQAQAFNPSVDIIIAPQVGAEVIAGSTRMKSGTAQKMVLNMLTSASMIKLGKTYGNIMIDLQLTNKKLQERAIGIIMRITGGSYDTAKTALSEAHGNVKIALFTQLTGANVHTASKYLQKASGTLKLALNFFNLDKSSSLS